MPIGPFRTWIALHETTHAFEFEAHPWLRPYLASRLERQLTLFGKDVRRMGREASAVSAARSAGRGGRRALDRAIDDRGAAPLFRETQAVMSLLEGFSDYVMDEVGQRAGPRRRVHPCEVRRASGSANAVRARDAAADRDGPQARAVQEGREFVRAIAAARGPSALTRLWDGPESCRSDGEIEDPARWIARVLDRRRRRRQPRDVGCRPGRGPGGAPTAIALSPILSARYRSRDLERIRAAAPGARLVTVSVEGLADGPLDDVEVMLRGWLSSDAFDRLLARAPHMAWVHSATSGVERALTPASRERGLVVTNARGVFSRPIAEYVLMMILSVSRKLPELLELQRERTWQPLEGAELRDVTVGIVGLGSIGRAVGALATAFGCRVWHRRRPTAATVQRARRQAATGRARSPGTGRSVRSCSIGSAGPRRSPSCWRSRTSSCSRRR